MNPIHHAWTEAEDALMREHYGKARVAVLAGMLRAATGIERSIPSLWVRAHNLGLAGGPERADGLLSVAEVGRRLGIPYNTLDVMRIRGKLAAERHGARWYVQPEEMERLRGMFAPAPERHMSAKAAAKRLGYTWGYVCHLLKAGNLRGVLRGRTWYVDAEHVEQLAAELMKSGATRYDWMKKRRKRSKGAKKCAA